MSGKLEGKVALVTGANSGIGLATAKRFVGEGAYVFITGRRQDELYAAVKEIGKNVTAVQGDVAKLADLDRLFVQIKREKGRLDIVFANAGVAELAPLGEITEEDFDRMFSINVKGLLFTVQKALPLLPNGGSIILNASIVASKGNPASSVYSATKAAVRSFARTWTMDLKERKIRVNAISPGPIRTPAYDRLAQSGPAGKQMLESIVSRVPMGRFGEPDEIARAAVFLASEDSTFVTGTGRATAIAFARDGARIVISGRRDEVGQKLVAELRDIGAEAEYWRSDVRRDDDVRELVDKTVKRFGRLDIAVNNAGTEGKTGPVTQQTAESYAATFDTNVLGTLLSMKHELRVMLPQGSGSIVNISSAYGSVGAAGAAVYVASKHAVEGMTKSAALEVAGTGVRVNVVAPGATDTAMLSRFSITDENKAALVSTVPVKRLATPEQIADVIVFVGSAKASYMTGSSIAVDGGMLAG